MNRVLLTTLALAAACAAPASADENELVVTATRAPASAARLPARIDTIGRDDIEARSLSTLAEALGSAAVQAGSAGQQASLFLRGANSKHALALLDGIRLNDASTPNAQYDFGLDTLGWAERVEVLRGPASSLYGSDAIGGVVNVLPRRGGDSSFEPFLETAATPQLGGFRTLIGAAGASGGFAYGLSAERLQTEGYDLVPQRMAGQAGDDDGAAISALTATARMEAGSAGLDALVQTRRSGAEYDTFSGGPFFDLRADDPDLGGASRQSVWRLGLDAGWGPLALRASAGQVRAARSEHDGGAQLNAARSLRDFADAHARYRGAALDLTAGASFERNSIDTAPQFAAPLSAEEEHSALYLLGQTELRPWLIATGSARIDRYDGFGEHASFSAGVVAAVARLRLFAAYATAFKAPSLSERFETSLFNLGNPALEPESARSWEAGADYASGALSLGVSFYRTGIDELIEYDFARRMNLNAGAAEIDGVEFRAETALSPAHTFALNYHWTDARSGAGARLPRRPEHAAQAALTYAPSARSRIALSWTYVGERIDVTYADSGAFLSAAGRAPAYEVGSLSATLDIDERAQIFLRIDNLADATYEQPAAFAAPPRALTVGLRARLEAD